MTKDYLTSPFNDGSLIRQFTELASTLNNLGINKIEQIPQETSRVISKQMSMINDSIRPMAEPVRVFNQIAENNQDVLKQTAKTIKSFANSPLFANYSKLVKYNAVPFRELNLSNAIDSFESFLKEQSINSNQSPQEERSPSGSKSKINIRTEQRKIEKLQFVEINFVKSVDKYKEFFHKSFSYASERRVILFGLSSNFSLLITASAQIHSLLPYWIFTIISIIGLFTPKD